MADQPAGVNSALLASMEQASSSSTNSGAGITSSSSGEGLMGQTIIKSKIGGALEGQALSFIGQSEGIQITPREGVLSTTTFSLGSHDPVGIAHNLADGLNSVGDTSLGNINYLAKGKVATIASGGGQSH